MRKTEHKLIICSLLIIAFTISFLVSGCSVHESVENLNDKGEIVMNNGLTLKEGKAYGLFYKLGSNKAILHLDQLEETDDIEFYLTDDAKMLVALFNFKIWDYKSDDKEYDEKLEYARKVCGEYGFTSENRLNSKWVLDEPYDAYKMMKALPEDISGWINRGTEEKFLEHIIGISESGSDDEINEEVLENGLTLVENKVYGLFYKLGCNQEVFYLDATKDIEFFVTDDTEKVVALFSFFIWDYKPNYEHEEWETMRETCKKFGLTSDHRLNSQWVLENPIDAYNMVTELPRFICRRIAEDIDFKYKEYLE